jgi:hypothetical protein
MNDLRTQTYSGRTTEETEAAFHADLAAAAGAGYFPVSQRWDTTRPTPTLVVEYRHQRPAEASVSRPADTAPTLPAKNDSASAPERRKGNPARGCIAVLGVLIVAMWFVLQQSGYSGGIIKPPGVDPPGRQEPTEHWYPSGYSPWPDDPSVAYRWLDSDELDCEFGLRCTGLMVTSRDGCPTSLYVEAQVLNSSGVVVGGTNDSAFAGLEPREQARLVLSILEEDGRSTRLSDVSCF